MRNGQKRNKDGGERKRTRNVKELIHIWFN